MVTSGGLSGLYRIPVQVLELDGRKVILPPEAGSLGAARAERAE